MTVMQVDVQERMGVARAALVRRVVNIVAVVVAVAWSWIWIPPMLAGVRAHTELGANGVNGMPSAHALFEVLFVAAHWGIRWLPVMLLAAAAVVVTRRATRDA